MSSISKSEAKPLTPSQRRIKMARLLALIGHNDIENIDVCGLGPVTESEADQILEAAYWPEKFFHEAGPLACVELGFSVRVREMIIDGFVEYARELHKKSKDAVSGSLGDTDAGRWDRVRRECLPTLLSHERAGVSIEVSEKVIDFLVEIHDFDEAETIADRLAVA